MNFGIVQAQMNKIFIEKEHFYMVQIDSIFNRNGILTKVHIDSLLNNSVYNEKSGYIDVPAWERFNKNKINFDIYDDCLYSLTSNYSLDEFSTAFVKVPFQEIRLIHNVSVQDRVKSLGILAFNHEQRLMINRLPLSSNPYYRYPIDSSQIIHFDITYLDSLNMNILVYNNVNQEIENWRFYGEVAPRKKKKLPFIKARWKSTQRYKLKAPLTDNFVTTFINGNLYIFTNEGTIYLANEELLEVSHLPNRLDEGYIIFNKKEGEVHYIKKSGFRIEKQSLRELLKNAFKIDLKKE